MKHLAPLFLVAAALCVGLTWGTPSTAGQTAAPTVTPAATDSPTALVTPSATPLPSGRILLRRMEAAIKRYGTYREVDHSVVLYPGGTRSVFDSVTDQSVRRDRERITYTTPPSHSGKSSSDTFSVEILAGHLEASRTGGGRWNCIDWSKTLPGTFTDALTADGQRVIGGKARTIAAETLGTIPVWHVRTMTHYVTTGQGIGFTGDATTDDLISQADYSLLQQNLHWTIRDAQGTTRLATTSRYSDYGHAFHIRLPKACKQFHPPGAPLLTPLFRKSTQLAQSHTVHLTVHYLWSRKGKGRIAVTEQVDRLAKNAGYRVTAIRTVTGPGRHPSTTIIRQETIRVGKREATWQANQGWICGARTSTPPYGPRHLPASAQIVALGFRDNTSAWRVHIDFPNRSARGKVHATEDLFISAFRPQFVRSVYRRVDRTVSPPVRETLTIDYSRYGEHLTLRMPTGCRG